MPSALKTAVGRRGRGFLIGVAAAGATGLFAVPVASAAGPAVLGITMTHLNAYGAQCETAEKAAKEGCVDPYTESPTTFARESGSNLYAITVSNTGGSTSGAVTVVDHLPEGMDLADFAGARLSKLSNETGWNCAIESEATTAKCTNTRVLAENAHYLPLTLPVLVKPQPSTPSTNVVTNVATVSGGGALASAETAKTEGETTITPAVPFGIKSFTTTLVKEPKEPLTEPLSELFSEAGGHPFAVTTEILFNYTPSSESSVGNLSEERAVAAEGGAKEVQAEVPPGFVGNPQNSTLCPIESLRNNRCPENTAVGYAQVTLQANIVKGKIEPFSTPVLAKGANASSLVYNLEPTPGHPAQFGFLIAKGVPFVLDAKLRSDGDYGVTVGDDAVGEKPVATRVTLCANGAEGEKVGAVYTCKKAPATSRPFLTNLVQCPSTPTWTVHADPWDDPTSYVSAETPQNPSVTCGEPLPFNPGLEFVPSAASEGGTSQADKPTGMNVNLSLPQSNEADVNGTPELKNVKMTLPAGMTISPAAADGIEACTNADFGLGTEFEAGGIKLPAGVKPTEPANPAKCPPASQVGTVEVFTPLLSGAPTIQGVPKGGEELTCSSGTWSNGAWNRSLEQRQAGIEELENGNHERLKISYLWLRNNAAIPGATSREYAPQKEDEGKPLQCQVTAQNEGGSSVALSREVVDIPLFLREPSTAPPPVAPASIAAPSGTVSVGDPLTCTSASWTGAPKEPLQYQWLRNGVAIADASSTSYTLTSEDIGRVIQCQVTATNGPAGKESVVSADSAAVVVPSVPSPPPPLPGGALQGQLFVGEPECNPCTEANHDAAEGRIFRLFLQAQDPTAGVVVKLYGNTSVNEETGQLTTNFINQPQQPFELLGVKLKGGPTATLANPQTCGTATTTANLTPWSSPFTPEPTPPPTSSFNVEGCSASMPFSPGFNAGTEGANATAAGTNPSEFALTFSRQDGEQDLSAITVHMPLGLVGKIAGTPLCGEAQANAGTCGPESQIGTATAYAGPGSEPFASSGRVYLTGPYKGGPFGLSVVTPAVSGPHDEFNLGNVVVRSAIYIDEHTAAVSVVSDPLPQFRDGVQLRLKTVNVKINKSGFMYNPTNCSAQSVSATLSAAQGASANVSSPFGLAGCTGLPFKPTFTATSSGQTSKTLGASLDVKISYPPGAYANIGKSLTELPISLPSRLTTIQKACVDTVFEANPAACDEGSVIGHAIAYTPLLANPLAGPAYLVSHGNRAFPDIEIVLQGEGITVDLDGLTDIKKGVTKTTFESLPDSPISTFELTLPEGPHSALGPNVEYPLCEQPSVNLPTVLTGQNGAVLKQNTKVDVTGCTPSVKIAKAKLDGNGLLVTVATAIGSTTGTVKISGHGFKTTTKKGLAPGSHQILVPFTKVGMSLRAHHKKATIRISLTVGKKAVVKSTSARL